MDVGGLHAVLLQRSPAHLSPAVFRGGRCVTQRSAEEAAVVRDKLAQLVYEVTLFYHSILFYFKLNIFFSVEYIPLVGR